MAPPYVSYKQITNYLQYNALVDAIAALEAAPPGPEPATTIVTEKAFGQSEAVGTGTKYARNDHTHGTPTDTAFTNWGMTDQTDNRVIGTTYTNGSKRRIILVTLELTNDYAGAGVRTPATAPSAQSTIYQAHVATITTQMHLVGFVNPGATYKIENNSGGAGSIALVRWIEIDL